MSVTNCRGSTVTFTSLDFELLLLQHCTALFLAVMLLHTAADIPHVILFKYNYEIVLISHMTMNIDSFHSVIASKTKEYVRVTISHVVDLFLVKQLLLRTCFQSYGVNIVTLMEEISYLVNFYRVKSRFAVN